MHGHEVLTADPGLLVLTGIWLAMMTAMMAPVAAPWVLAFSRFGTVGTVRDTRSVVATLLFIAGYLTYDYTHFHLHHHVPKTTAGKQLREQHMRHHFQDHRYGYGVSSPLWDIVVFRTLPRRRG